MRVGMGMGSAKAALPAGRSLGAVAAAARGRVVAPALWLGAAVGLFVVLDAGPAFAGKCGGTRECVCGDKVVEDYQLPRDLGPCPETGLRLVARVRLDGAGFAIRGKGGKGSVGVRIGDRANGSEVRDLAVTGFARGLRLVDVRDVRVVRVEALENGDVKRHRGYGIDVSGSSADNVIEQVRVHHNADEGIHLGSGVSGNRIVNSDVFSNYRENVYFLENRGSRLERSRIRDAGKGSAAVYIKGASDVVLEGNRIEDGNVTIRGVSKGVQLIDNSLHDASVVLQAQENARPANTVIRGGGIESSKACVRVEAADGTRFEDVARECKVDVQVEGSSRITLRGAGSVKVRCAGAGEVVQLRAVDVRFVDETGQPVAAAVGDAKGAELAKAGPDGRFRADVEVMRVQCPGERRVPASSLRVSGGALARVVAPSELRGDVVLKRP
jgi:parallel beta-helix repeat protein